MHTGETDIDSSAAPTPVKVSEEVPPLQKTQQQSQMKQKTPAKVVVRQVTCVTEGGEVTYSWFPVQSCEGQDDGGLRR
jgi:hypothetical protein